MYLLFYSFFLSISFFFYFGAVLAKHIPEITSISEDSEKCVFLIYWKLFTPKYSYKISDLTFLNYFKNSDNDHLS